MRFMTRCAEPALTNWALGASSPVELPASSPAWITGRRASLRTSSPFLSMVLGASCSLYLRSSGYGWPQGWFWYVVTVSFLFREFIGNKGSAFAGRLRHLHLSNQSGRDQADVLPSIHPHVLPCITQTRHTYIYIYIYIYIYMGSKGYPKPDISISRQKIRIPLL